MFTVIFDVVRNVVQTVFLISCECDADEVLSDM